MYCGILGRDDVYVTWKIKKKKRHVSYLKMHISSSLITLDKHLKPWHNVGLRSFQDPVTYDRENPSIPGSSWSAVDRLCL